MTLIAPSWAFAGQAIDWEGDSHLAPGIHYRVLTHPLLGLPIAPLVVTRANLGAGAKRGGLRHDAIWIDSRRNVLSPPFDVEPDNPVSALLPVPATGVCCWARVDGEPDDIGPFRPLPRPPLLGAALRRFAIEPTRSMIPFPAPRPRFDPRLVTLFRRKAAFTVEAVVTATTPAGSAVVATSRRAPYDVYASHIERLVVRGRGRVTGLSWLDAGNLRGEPFDYLDLPTPSANRYTGFPDAPDRAEARVRKGAPRRLGLHDEPDASSAAAASPATPDDEWARVDRLAVDRRHCLDRLTDDLSAPPWDLFDDHPVVDHRGVTIGRSTEPCLGSVLQSTTDPGMAHWLGFLDVDQEPPADQTEVMAYLVTGVWQPNADGLAEQELDQLIPGAARLQSIDEVAQRFRDHKWGDHLPDMEGPFFTGTVALCATVGNPLATPANPVLGTPDDGRASRIPPLSDWLPTTPPNAQRQVVVPVSRLSPAAGIAFARREAGNIMGLNPQAEQRAQLIVPAVPTTATESGTGELSDITAPPEDVDYRAAQSDWFGRWSGWAQRSIGSGVRPIPPRPTINTFYEQPTFGHPIPAGPLPGTIDVRVAVPGLDALPPGAHLLDHLDLSLDHEGALTTTSHSLPSPAAPPDELAVAITGPALTRASTSSVTLTGRWVDSVGTPSTTSEPKTLQITDPRPPESLTFPPTVSYASRPDVTGRARVTLAWTPSGAQRRFRVFYADETGLTARLSEVAAGSGGDATNAATILSDIEGAGDLPSRAQVYRDHQGFLARDWFQQLTGAPLEANGSSPMTLEHALSGSLRVLSFYRVVAVSASNVESPFGEAPIVPYAVPNTGAPSQPSLEAVPVLVAGPPPALGVSLSVIVPRGVVPAVAFRLRRSSTSSDLLRMPVAALGTVPSATTGHAQRFTVIDLGGSELDPSHALRPWTSYSWRIEVQGANEPGGGPPGEWSLASPAVSTTVIPPDPPEPARNVSATPAGGVVRIQFDHPDPLLSGNLGGYSLDVYRQRPGEAMRYLGSLSAEEPPPDGRMPDRTGPFTYRDTTGSIPTGTRYQVIVTDPLGRTSPPSDPATT